MLTGGGVNKKYIVNYFLYTCIRCNFATGEKSSQSNRYSHARTYFIIKKDFVHEGNED